MAASIEALSNSTMAGEIEQVTPPILEAFTQLHGEDFALGSEARHLTPGGFRCVAGGFVRNPVSASGARRSSGCCCAVCRQ